MPEPLISCPFCGCKASMIFTMFSRYIQCLSCGARSAEHAIGPGMSIETAEITVTRLWNGRVQASEAKEPA